MVALLDPHFPYQEPADLVGQFETAYEAEIHQVDRHVRQILDELERQGRRDRTIICLTSDHGEGLGEHGEDSHGVFVYEGTMHVPLIFSGPDVSPRRIPQPVGLADVAPTLLELAKVPPFPCTGRSLVPAIQGQSLPAVPVYLESYLPYLAHGWSPLEAVVDGNWKYISASQPELYDLGKDPTESANLVTQAAQRGSELDALLSELTRIAPQIRFPRDENIVDENLTARLRELGYLNAQGDAAFAEDLPRPQPGQGIDPKTQTDLLPWLVELEGLKTRDRQAAEGLARKILARDAENIRGLQTLGILLVQTNREAEGLIYLTRLDGLGRNTVHSLSALARARFATGDLDGAITGAQRCLQKQPTESAAWFTLASAYEQLGDHANAIVAYQKLKEQTTEPARRQWITERIAQLGGN